MKIVRRGKGYIIRTYQARITHDRGTAPRLYLGNSALRFIGKTVVTPQLMSYFVGDVINVKTLPLRIGSRSECGSFFRILAQRTDITSVAIVGSLVEEMT